MVKSSEHEKLWRYSNYNSPNFRDVYEVGSADPQNSKNMEPWFTTVVKYGITCHTRLGQGDKIKSSFPGNPVIW